MADEQGNIVTVELTQDEVKFIVECCLNCPITASVKEMPRLFVLAQSIIKKLQSKQAEG